MNDLMPRIQSIFQDVFDDPALTITEATTARNVPGWDSLSTINLVFALESDFKIKFALGEIQELKNVGEMAALIQKKSGMAARAH
jgi:acyl carrier protein